MIDLRPITADDAPAITALYAPFVATNAVSFETAVPSVDDMRTRITATNGHFPWIAAIDKDSDTLLGYAFAKPFRPGETYRFVAEVALYAMADVEGQGVRRSLIATLCATMTAQNFTQAICTLMTPNDKLIQLYEGHGFRRAGVYREVSYKNGQWNDVGLWQRELAHADTPPDALKPFSAVGVVRS
ncbi:MAG: N-acetyltransferase family protein [Sphingomonadaceae bacterium]